MSDISQYILLVEMAKQCLLNSNSVDQVVLMLSTQNKLYRCLFCDHISVENMIEGLMHDLTDAEDTKMSAIVCMWKNYVIDMPSWKVRKALMDLDNDNSSAVIVLQGTDSIYTKTITAIDGHTNFTYDSQ